MKAFKLFLKENGTLLVVCYVFAIITVILSFYCSIGTKTFYNAILNNNALSARGLSLFYLIGAYAVILIVSVWSTILTHRMLYKGMLNIRHGMMYHLLHTPFQYFSSHNVGQIWSEMVSTTNEVGIFHYSLLMLPIDLTEVIVYGFILFNQSVTAGLIICAFIPLIIITTFFSGKRLSRRRGEGLSQFRAVASWATETLTYIKMIKTTSSQDYFLDAFSEKHERMNRTDVKVSVLNTYVDAVQNLIIVISPLIVVFLSTRLTSVKDLGTGELVILYTFTPLFFNAFRSLYARLYKFFGVKPARTSVAAVLSLEGEAFGFIHPEERLQIDVRDFHYRMGDKEIKIPDFSIKPGDKVLISGESGMGKSTLFNCLTGIHTDFQDTLLLNNRPLKDYDLSELRKKILLVSQEPMIFSGTLRDNLFMNLSDSVSEEALQSCLKLLRLNDLYKRETIGKDELSGGEKARINLAQALLRKPECLLIDETLSLVDEAFEKEIITHIINENPDMSVVYITHRTSVQNMFDRVVRLEGGIR
ncbi:MAG TPA: ABC transporter ATP-binding protein [Thermotogota bacterium]|nr:ABC transporter ATP-binding protein [Thermotogota bacterium]